MIQEKSETVSLYVVEEQEIYREMYRYVLPNRSNIEILRVSENSNTGAMERAASELNPDVLLLSVKKLNIDIIEELERIRNSYPRMGIVILIIFYSSQDIELLRRLALCGESGMALFLKQSLDKVDQLCRMILAVSQGQVILDPPLATFMFAGKPECPFLKQLTTRELEILSLLSQGYTNSAIANTLFIDIKTVEHHLNSMYSKLKADPGYNSKHLRVSAARLYLETMGSLYQKEEPLVRAGGR
ncbi:MAG TPA: response regulator transcription factor [Dehalococcoidales bacterium]|nr:response regulator transcription factor [Dehalococcoidales bacterium]